MKGKIISGKGLSGLKKYVEKDDAEFIAGSCRPEDFLRTCAALREQRPDCQKAAIHISISQPPGEPLTATQWQQAGEILMEEMGLQDCEFLMMRHHDTAHDHAHLIACKIKPDGTLWNDSHSARRLHKACEKIEEKMGLTVTPTVEQHRADRKAGRATKPMGSGSIRQFQRTGTVPNATAEAIRRRIKNERSRADRESHNPTDEQRGIPINGNRKPEFSGRGADRPDQKAGGADRADRGANREAGRAEQENNRGAEHAHPEIKRGRQEDEKEFLEQAFLTKKERENMDIQKRGATSRTIDDEEEPPTLGKRLRAKLREDGKKKIWDLYWQNCEKPSFSYAPDERKIELLAAPNEKNVSVFFDLLEEKNMRPLSLFGDDKFIKMAVEEAHKRGYPLSMDDKRVKAAWDELEAAKPKPTAPFALSPALTKADDARAFAAIAKKPAPAPAAESAKISRPRM